MITAKGAVLQPSVAALGWPLLVLTVVGLGGALFNGGVLPVVAFAAGCLAQMFVLFALDAPYMAFKTLHLFIYPLAVLGAYGLSMVTERVMAVLGKAAANTHATVASFSTLTARATAWLPLVIASVIMIDRVPSARPSSAVDGDALRAGTWARAFLPTGCVDYVVPHWVTAYWLHLDILGNPRMSARTADITEEYEYRSSIGRWIEPGSLPYAVVGDVEALPNEVRSNVRILQQFGRTAVVERTSGARRCDDRPIPFERLRIAPRADTFAARILNLWN
jgi:hypothetical protein